MSFPESYYRDLREAYRERRDLMMSILQQAGFRPFMPHGAYYVMCDISGFGWPDDVSFARDMVRDLGVAVVPGSSFYSDPSRGRQQVRFAFPKRLETLRAVAPRLRQLSDRPR